MVARRLCHSPHVKFAGMTSVRGLLGAADLSWAGVARWGQKPALFDPGVYLVATTRDPDDEAGLLRQAIDSAAVRMLLQVRPEANVDGVAATEQSVTDRLRALWVPGQPVLYIGLATVPVSDRVGQYYSTKIGARAPHAGGWPLKMIANLDQTWVHYAAADDPADAEQRLLSAFRAGLSEAVVAALHDPQVVLPYANLELTKGLRKAHGFRGVKAPRSISPATSKPTTSSRTGGATAAAAPTSQPPRLVTNSRLRTQNVTSADLAAGRIRVPSETKRLFPREKATIEVEVCGERLTCKWDPKYGPDKERSGTVSVGRAALGRLVAPDRPLTVTTADGVVRMGYLS